MLFLFAFAASCPVSVVGDTPSPRYAETTLAELSIELAKNGTKLEIQQGLANRPLFVWWEPQGEEKLIAGLAYSLGLKTEHKEDGTWKLTQAPDPTRLLLGQLYAKRIKEDTAYRSTIWDLTDDELNQRVKDLFAQGYRRPNNPNVIDPGSICIDMQHSRLISRALAGVDANKLAESLLVVPGPRDAIVVRDEQLIKKTLEALNKRESEGTLRNQPSIGAPMVVVSARSQAQRIDFWLQVVYANRSIPIEFLMMPRPTLEWKKSFDPKAAPFATPFHRPQRMLELGSGTSFEILPDAAKQLKQSFASWANTDVVWREVAERTDLATLVSKRAVTLSRGIQIGPNFAFEQSAGWIRVAEPTHLFSDQKIDWTQLLPVLRRVRNHELGVDEILKWADAVSPADATLYADVTRQRFPLCEADRGLIGGVLLLRALSAAKIEVPKTGEIAIRTPIADLPGKSRELITKHLLTSRFWPHMAHLQHPDAPSLFNKRSFNVLILMDRGKRWMGLEISEVYDDTLIAWIPIP